MKGQGLGVRRRGWPAWARPALWVLEAQGAAFPRHSRMGKGAGARPGL